MNNILPDELSAGGDYPKILTSDEATTINAKKKDGKHNIMYRKDVRREFSDSLGDPANAAGLNIAAGM